MGERVEALVGQQAKKFLAVELSLKEAEEQRDKAQHELDVLVKALMDKDIERYACVCVCVCVCACVCVCVEEQR
jgi:hypothetical protein